MRALTSCRRRWPLVLICLTLLLGLPRWHASFFRAHLPAQCDRFPDTKGIQLVMKTGATESFAKMPIHLLTSLQCLPDTLLFSDLEQQMGVHRLENVLDGVDEAIKETRVEFALYHAQTMCPLSQDVCTAGIAGAWHLDKYKFLNMVERTWEKRPGMDWYVFAEADSYILWSNLALWLRGHRPTDELYAGSVALSNNRPFAHGGSGYVVSGATMKKMNSIPGLAAKYDELAGQECCGDLLFSMAVGETGGQVQQAHPMFNGEKPSTLPYGPGHWCQPLLTMHHVSPEDVAMIWQFEQMRTGRREIIRIKDIYQAFVAPHMVPLRQGWDNLSDDVCYIASDREAQERARSWEKDQQKPEQEKDAIERRAHESPASCAKVCEPADLATDGPVTLAPTGHGCFQWRYSHAVCCVGNSFRLGRPRHEIEQEQEWTSGWFLTGIRDWIDAQGECQPIDWEAV